MFKTVLVSLALLVSFGADPAGARWRQILPASGGAVYTIAVDSGGVLYISSNAGLLKSADLGQSWTSVSGNLALSGNAALAADPVTPGLLYAGTNQGLFRSNDSGFTWNRLNVSTASPIQYIEVAPSNPNNIYFTTWGDYIYRSLDGGATWSHSTQGLLGAPNAGFMSSLAVDPTTPARIYTSTWRGNLFRSDDGGSTWTLTDNGFWANGQIYVAPSNRNILYMIYDELNFGRGTIIKSTDTGNSWSAVGRPTGNPGGVAQLAIHPTNPNIVYATTNLGLSKSTDGGLTWSMLLTPGTLPLRLMYGLAINPGNPAQVFAGSNYFGFYRSMDSGASWFLFNNGLAGATITEIEFCRDNPAYVYAGVQTVGFLKSGDGGATWNPIGTAQGLQNHAVGGIAVHPNDPSTVLVGTQAGNDTTTANIWFSSDGGSTFSAVANGYAPGMFRFNPRNPNLVNTSIQDYQGGYLYSTNAGMTWAVPAFVYIYPGDYVYHPTLSNVVFSIGNQYTGAPLTSLYVLWSNASGNAPWNQSPYLGSGHFDVVALDQNTPTILYVGGRIGTEGSQGIYKFTITYNGSNVASVSRQPGTFNAGLGNTTINHLYYEPVNGYLYASTPTGIYRSKDQANTWTSISDGLPFLTTNLIAGSPDGKRLLVGTGGGIWEYTDTPVQSPVASVSPAALDFSAVGVGTPLTANFLNIGDGQMAISSVASTSTDFTVTNTCPTTLNPGANCRVLVNFTPSTSGFKSGLLQIASNALNGTQTVQLSGTYQAGAPVARVTPAAVIFANQPLGTTSAPQSVSVQNTGTAALHFLTPQTSNSFNIVGNTCTGALAVGATCSIQVTFGPSAQGSFNGQLQIADDASNSPQTVTLKGPSMLDSDGDGIPDDWERNGVWVGNIFLDLPKMGANWLHKDLFVELDWWAQGDHSHQLKPEAMQLLIDAFANVPVSNPDGISGITLHLDCGPTCIMDPLAKDPSGNPQPSLWGTMSQANPVPHVDPLTGSILEIGSRDIYGQYQWLSFDQTKQVNFSPARANVFHYVLFAHALVRIRPDKLDTSSGLTRATPANDSMVTLGYFTTDPNAPAGAEKYVGTAPEQAGTLMHELGHSLGLMHGGPVKYNDSITNKPNDLSVMNYLYQTRGLWVNKSPGVFAFSSLVLPALDQNALYESAGLGPPITGYGIRYYCPDGSIKDLPDATGWIDWNCDLTEAPGPIKALISGAESQYPLMSYMETDSLIFTGSSIGQPGAPAPPVATPTGELTKELNAQIPTVHGVAVTGHGNASLPLGGVSTLSFSVYNKGSGTDTFLLNPSSTQSWVDVSGVPKSISLGPGVTQTFTLPVHPPASTPLSQAISLVVFQAILQSNSLILDSAQSMVTAGAADLSAAISGTPNPLVMGGNMTYSVTITNNGPNPAHDIVLTNPLPAGATLVSANTATGSCVGVATLTCTLGELNPGGKTLVTIVVTPTVTGAMTDTASVTESVYDPLTSNNSASFTSTVVGKPSLSAKVSGHSESGTTVTVNLTLSNIGTGPANATLISQVTVKTLAGTGTVIYTAPATPATIGTITDGTSKTVALTFTVPATVTQFSIAEKGTMTDAAGNIYSFGASQSVIP